jgi:O-antigen ligase
MLIAVAIVQTGSRGGLLALAVGLLTFLSRAPTPWARLRNALGAVAMLAFLGVAAYRSQVMRNRLENAATTGKFAVRERIYPALLGMFRERPLLGWGPIENQFELERRLREPDRERRDAHNLVLELLTTTGVVGIAPFLAGLLLCLRSAWRARRTARGVLPLAMLASMLVGVMSGTWIASKILWFTLAHAHSARGAPAEPSA